jgi:hypothetical protein
MTLNSIERDFLMRLSFEPWKSPPVFDHGLIDRLVHRPTYSGERQIKTRGWHFLAQRLSM